MDKLHTSLQLIVTYPRPFLPDSFVSLFGIIQSLKTGTTSWDSMWTNSWLFYAVTTFQVCSRTEPQCSFGVCCGRALIAVHAITSAGWIPPSRLGGNFRGCLVPPLSRREMFHGPPGCQYWPARRRRLRVHSATTKSNRTRRDRCRPDDRDLTTDRRPRRLRVDPAADRAGRPRVARSRAFLCRPPAARRGYLSGLRSTNGCGSYADAIPAIAKSKLRRKERH